jgi:hypothetical protein
VKLYNLIIFWGGWIFASSGKKKAHSLDIKFVLHRSADKSLARPGRKQATAAEDFDFHISYL